MKVLFICSGRNFSDEEIQHLNQKELDGFERVSSNAFMFDASKSASLLADLQSYCHGLRIKYNLFYFEQEPIVFTSP
ncbi:hypothetical protein [Acinetobacter pseudolwoffii]|uniref:hypothetical protein n=1 Tax=Acinetobacter pseudolwoffii TaxID=2053287 RepID=UPI0021E3A6AB|nr:hypothetical protein [Acinetobacter pseudolwoffii]